MQLTKPKFTFGTDFLIRNPDQDFKVTNTDGIGVRSDSGDSLDKKKAFTIYDSDDNIVGYLWGTTFDDTIRLVSEDNLVLEAKAGDLLLGATGNIRLTNLPTSDPGVSGALWNNNGTLKIS